jgi:putative ABC transport system permease protein
VLALWGASFVESLGAQVSPLLSGIKIDGRVLVFTTVISILAGIFFGLAPALRTSSPELSSSLKEGNRGSGTNSSRSRLRDALIVSEIAMALVLLVCAGLLIKSVMRLRGVEPGFETENRLTMNIALPGVRYPKPHDWAAFYDKLTARVEALPGVKAAGLTSVLPLSNNFDGRGLAVEDRPKPRGEEISVDLYIASPNYLPAMSIPTLRGRPLSAQDAENSPLSALVNETMAEELWPGEDPLGKRIRFAGADTPGPWRTIVGVVGDVRQYGLDKKVPRQIYLPQSQYPTAFMSLVVHTSSDPEALAASVRREVYAIDKEQAVYNVATMKQLMADSISLRRFFMLLLIVFAALALALAAIGIYGVMAYTVTQRTHEIGIRMALGARRGDVLNLVLRQGVLLTIAGVALGLFIAFALTRLIAGLLYEVGAADPSIFAGTAAVLAAIALLACYIPARRATKVDPMIALRHE